MDAKVAGVATVPSPLTGYRIVTAVMRDGDRVLMVQEHGPDETTLHWALPGGVVEADELLTEALAREVREETGLEVLDPGRLLYVLYCVDDVPSARHSVVFAFEVGAWHGDLCSADPDGLVLGVRFRPVAEMAAELTDLGPVRSRPLVSFLHAEVGPGPLWLYRRDADGREQMTVCPRP